MEKIKLTQEQADLIEVYKNSGISDSLKFIESFSVQGRFYLLSNQCLNSLTVEELSICLLVSDSYEVIPQYKVGDWVVYVPDNSIWEITKDTYNDGTHINLMNGNEIMNVVSANHLRHATPEEIQQEKKRRFWEKLGREVYEYEEGDIVGVEGSKFITYISYEDLDRGEVEFPRFTAGDNKYFPLNKIRLVTPVEKRLDK